MKANSNTEVVKANKRDNIIRIALERFGTGVR